MPLKSFFPYKDRINRSLQPRIIYWANCWDCNGFYIGKTKRRLHDRKTEHCKAPAKNDNTSAIADHIKTTGHNIKWDHFEPDKLSKISQVLEKSQENFAVWLTLSFSQQLVSRVNVRQRYVFSAFQNSKNIFCYRACKPSPKGRHAEGQAWQNVASSNVTVLSARFFQFNSKHICGAHCNRNKSFTETSLESYRLVLLSLL